MWIETLFMVLNHEPIYIKNRGQLDTKNLVRISKFNQYLMIIGEDYPPIKSITA